MNNQAIVVHGGCGRVEKSSIQKRLSGVREAAEIGWEILRCGGSAVNAVEAAVVALEDNPLFNAGRGSVLNSEGRIEMDAAIMDGMTRHVGAVAGITGILNPITLARKVMDDSSHVLLISNGAEQFAAKQGFSRHDMEKFVVKYRQEEWEREHGTVGAVACDQEGRISAATSTGGSKGKLPGRVGDTPLIGCGTYADDGIAVSCTGNGECIIRMTLARLVAFLYEQGGSVRDAVGLALRQLQDKTGGEVGLIAVDAKGCATYSNNSRHMPICCINKQHVILHA